MNRDLIEQTLRKVSDCMIHLDDQGQKEEFPVSLLDMECWEWPQGVGLTGLIRYAASRQDRELLSFAEGWFDRHIANLDRIERNVNTSSPMLALSYLYEVCPKAAYLEAMRDWADWIMDPRGLIRTGDGCIQHMITGDPNHGQILIDTLYMTVLFLLRSGRLFKRPDMIAEGNRQILKHIEYLFDKDTGLFYHGWSFDRMDNYGKVHWLRGNAWYTVGSADFIYEQDQIPPDVRNTYEKVLREQAEALKRYRDDSSRLWRTVIDCGESYIELSGSCAVLCGIMKAIRYDVLREADYLTLVREGVAGALGYIDEQGAVKNVSYGTPVGMDRKFYMDIPCYTMTYGQAMMILLLQECLEPYWNGKL